LRLVVFDLDGTITRRDTLLPYVTGFLSRRPWRLWRLLAVAPALIPFLLGRCDRGELKSALLKATLRGATDTEFEGWTAVFVPRLLARGAHAQALASIEQHRRLGDVLVLLSASPDLYVPAIARQLGFAEAICTGVRRNGHRLDGALSTPNRRGEEKTRCLTALRQRYPGLSTAAYANATSDLDHLLEVDEPHLVNGSPRARARARRLGIPTLCWR
jgi:phosphatidylglycerophosphatase C